MAMNAIAIARPYAKAAFECAKAEKTLENWSAFLKQAAFVVNSPNMLSILKNPEADEKAIMDFFLSVCGEKQLFLEAKKFLQLIAEHRRLLILPEIERLFEAYKAKEQHRAKLQVVSAIPLNENEKLSLTQILEKRLQCQIEFDYVVESSLLGGLLIRLGDQVIDASVRGILERLRVALVD